MKLPYEPLRKALDRDLDFKALFLLALALEGLCSFAFSFVPKSTAKTQNPSVPDERCYRFPVPYLPPPSPKNS